MRDYIPLSKTQAIGLSFLLRDQKEFIHSCLDENIADDERSSLSKWVFDGKGFRLENSEGFHAESRQESAYPTDSKADSVKP